MDLTDITACHRALAARDRRFDGRLYVGVTSTGIYCRPICPARTPRIDHCRFFASAAAAQAAGFRPCLRCRPELAPDLASWRGTANSVSRALALIAEGALDGEDARVADLAARVGLGERHLRRLFDQHLGASPIAVAQTRRVLFAKQLVQETDLPFADIALAAGFGSVRRFNEVFGALFKRPPTALRRARPSAPSSDPVIRLRLTYRPPYDWPAMLAHLRARAIPGVERVAHDRYARVIDTPQGLGVVEVAHWPQRDALAVSIRCPDVSALPTLIARLRRVFDTGCDMGAIGTHLAGDPALAPLVAARPGLRVPGGFDGFELAVRAILGQQVTVGAARLLAARLTRALGRTLAPGDGPTRGDAEDALTHAFPEAAAIARSDLSMLPMPEARRRALRALAETALADPHLFQTWGSLEDAVARLRRVPGIGDWTAHYVALRALREPDAFPASDVGLMRGLGRILGERPDPAGLLARAETWRPWRAYAAQYLWTLDAETGAARS